MVGEQGCVDRRMVIGNGEKIRFYNLYHCWWRLAGVDESKRPQIQRDTPRHCFLTYNSIELGTVSCSYSAVPMTFIDGENFCEGHEKLKEQEI